MNAKNFNIYGSEKISSFLRDTGRAAQFWSSWNYCSLCTKSYRKAISSIELWTVRSWSTGEVRCFLWPMEIFQATDAADFVSPVESIPVLHPFGSLERPARDEIQNFHILSWKRVVPPSLSEFPSWQSFLLCFAWTTSVRACKSCDHIQHFNLIGGGRRTCAASYTI